MTFHIGSDGPIYRQLADQVLAGVKAGLLKPGDRLPTERELAAQLGVARGTVRKAYRELADNNLVQVIQGSGVDIHSDGGQLDSRRRPAAANLPFSYPNPFFRPHPFRLPAVRSASHPARFRSVRTAALNSATRGRPV